MELGVLGPFVASLEGSSIVPRAEQPQQVLALLALRVNSAVSMTELKQELWGDCAPVSAVTVVQNYVARLRKSIANQLGSREAAHGVLVTEPTGYSLRVDPEGLDVVRFEHLVREGSRALAQQSATTAAEALRQALSIWRGPMLSGIHMGPVLTVEAVRLDMLRLLAVEQQLDANLQVGRHYELLGELSALVQRYPFAERLHQLYMVALHRTGRRAEALRVYERLSSSLDEQLGLQPSASMQRARSAVRA